MIYFSSAPKNTKAPRSMQAQNYNDNQGESVKVKVLLDSFQSWRMQETLA